MVKYCADPLRVHKKKIDKGLRQISEELYNICGRKIERNALLCDGCRKRIKNNPQDLNEPENLLYADFEGVALMEGDVQAEQLVTSKIQDPTFLSKEVASEDVDMLFSTLEVTPVKTSRYLRILLKTINMQCRIS